MPMAKGSQVFILLILAVCSLRRQIKSIIQINLEISGSEAKKFLGGKYLNCFLKDLLLFDFADQGGKIYSFLTSLAVVVSSGF